MLKYVEYDPNPLQSLGKRTKSKVNVDITDANQPSTSTNVFSQFHSEANDEHLLREQREAYKYVIFQTNSHNIQSKYIHVAFIYSNRERRRLKKLRKDKMRQLSSTDEPNAKHKHKHKHKCGDELCKHRKHKKRRKHKKHHHRSAAAVAESDQIGMPNNSNEEEDEHCDSGSGTGSVNSHEPAPVAVEKAPENRKLQNARNALTKSVNIKLNKLEWPIDDDLISSVTEDSSGSSYVSLNGLYNSYSHPCKFYNQMNSNYRIRAT